MVLTNKKGSGYDRKEYDQKDKKMYYGYDYDDGTTLWIGEDGVVDCITQTPTCENTFFGDGYEMSS